MDPLTQDQVAALERAARDVDRMMETHALWQQRCWVVDWSLFEVVAIQGVPVRQVARDVALGRGHVRKALARVREELSRSEGANVDEDALQLYPPRTWEDNRLR